MKKLLYFLALTLALAFTTEQSQAQLLKTVVPTKDTCVNSDNTAVTVTPTTNAAVAFHFSCSKVSGTVAGTVTLQGSIDGTNWVTVGSDTLVNQSYNLITVTPTKLSFTKYRWYVATSGTCKINSIKGHYVIRN